jgi:hypothetical protein
MRQHHGPWKRPSYRACERMTVLFVALGIVLALIFLRLLPLLFYGSALVWLYETHLGWLLGLVVLGVVVGIVRAIDARR